MMTDKEMGCLLLVVFLLVALVAAPFVNAVDPSEALARFKEMAGTENVTIVRHTPRIPLIGNTRHITFELRVNGRLASGKCDTALVGPMVCQYFPSSATPPQ